MLTKDFNTEAQKLAKEDFDYAMRPEGGKAIGRIETTNDQYPDQDYKGEKNEKKKKIFEHYELMQMLEDSRRAMLETVERIQEEINELVELRDQAMRYKTALEEFLEGREASREYEVGTDGYPIDQAARDAIKAWEKKTGNIWNADSPDSFAMLDVIVSDYNETAEQLGRDIQHKIDTELDPALESLEIANKALERKDINQADLEKINRLIKSQTSSLEQATETGSKSPTPQQAIDLDLGF